MQQHRAMEEEADNGTFHLDRQMLSPFNNRRADSLASSQAAESPVWESEEEDLLGTEPDAECGGSGFRKKSAQVSGDAVQELRPEAELSQPLSPERRSWRSVGRKRREAEALEQEVLNLDMQYRELVRQVRS